jgi:signal peptidase II
MPEKTGRARASALKLFSFGLILFTDQSLKAWVMNRFQLGQSRPLIPGILHLTLVHNTGTAFGLFQDKNLFFIILSAVVIAGIAALLFKEEKKNDSPFSLIPLVLLLGGAAGNLIDRIRLGYVIDFIDFRVWPVFNLADSCITVGIIWLLLTSI